LIAFGNLIKINEIRYTKTVNISERPQIALSKSMLKDKDKEKNC
jgi:hypothetical protein